MTAASEGPPKASSHAWRPDEVRRKQFTVRLRGLDPNEVRGFLNLLADDLQRQQEQIATLKRDNNRQRDDLEQAQDELAQTRAELQQAKTELEGQLHSYDKVTDQAVQLLNQAQELADALIDEGMQSARELMMAARSHQREIVVAPVEAEPGTAASVAAAIENPETLIAVSPAGETGEVPAGARVSQAQFRAVLDALNEQINRLVDLSDASQRLVPVDSTPARTGAANGQRT